MPNNIITKDRIRSEFEKLKSQSFELSTPEICERVAFRLCIDVEAVEACIEEREQA